MLRKLKALRWNEQGRLIAAAAVSGFLLLLAALLPLAFRKDGEGDVREPSSVSWTGTFTTEEKAALFADYWYEKGGAITVEKLTSPDTGTTAFCRRTMEQLIQRCIDDQALTELTPTGSEYTVVSGGGVAVRLCRMWLQARGDWQNWLDVCFDAETGDVYYLYVSRECLTNQNLYVTEEQSPTAEMVGTELAAAFDGRLRYFLPGEDGSGVAVLSTAGGTLCYEIRCVSYDALVDIRVSCT